MMSEYATTKRQFRPWLLAALCGSLLLVSMGCHRHKPLKNRIKQLDERVTLLELRRSETESQLRKITEVKNALEEQLATSNQHNQALQRELTELKAQTQALAAEVKTLEARLSEWERLRTARVEAQKAKPKQPPKRGPAPAKAQPKKDRNRGVIRAYRAAIKLMQEGKNEAAAQTLQTIRDDHPNHVLAPNAHYWLGEIAYDKRDYAAAIQAFQTVMNSYPNSGKAPDALLKIGKSLERQNQFEEAKRTYQSVIDRFPKSRAATLAKGWLE